MSDPDIRKNLRILVVDDNRAIHEDFRKILASTQPRAGALEDVEAALFEAPSGARRRLPFEIDSAYQGQEALALVEHAAQTGMPYAVAFVDVRMPPGWDGVETTARLWKVCPDLQIVICTAYSDYSWDEMAERLESSDQLLILKKPFDTVEVLQLANALTEKWQLHQQVKLKFEHLEKLIADRTKILQETNDRLQAEAAERQRATEALRASEERYQLLFRTNPMPMWVFDRETLAFLAVNETAVQSYGYSVEEFLSMNLRDIRPREDVPLFLQRVAQLPQRREGTLVARHVKKSGALIDVEIAYNMISLGGREAGLVLANDITLRKSAEDRIREQATLLDLAQDAIMVRDLEGKIRFWNQGAERLYGWNPAEAVGNDTQRLFARKDRTAIDAATKVLLEKGEWTGELQKHNKVGQEVIVNSRWTLLKDESGQPRSILMIDTDITEKKRLETQFLRAQRMEGIGTLATGMAHDLNNILAPILMSAGTMRWNLTPDEREMAISRIEMSVKRGAEIIQQVLTFGRGVSGDRVAVNPGELLDEVSKITSQTFPKDVTIKVDVASSLWPIIGDKTQLHQVLLNLCINARDAMSGGGLLSLSASNLMADENFRAHHDRAKPGPYVLLQVSDTGCGIQSADLERIFDPFFTTKEFGKGTGLGLSTVLGIVRSHHGVVTVDSHVGVGTTFKVLLPASPAVKKQTIAVPATAAIPAGEGEAIMIVDDEENIVTTTRTALERSGYRVFGTKDGEEALALFAANFHSIEAVVTDLMMPGLDGLALIRALREIKPGVRIIASSGLDRDQGDASRAAELESLGIKTFLNKPYAAETLLTALRKELGGESNIHKPGSFLLEKPKRD